MKRLAWILFFILVAVVLAGLIVNTCHAWTFPLLITRGFSYTTPLGVRVSASDTTINLYESYWGLSWDDIDWDYLDDWLLAYRQHYGIEAPPPIIKISPMLQCINDGEDNFEIRVQLTCCTAAFVPPSYIYIGLNPNNAGIREGQTGQGLNAFCDTALDHELSHYFLYRLRSPCGYYGDLMPECSELFISGYALGLCD